MTRRGFNTLQEEYKQLRMGLCHGESCVSVKRASQDTDFITESVAIARLNLLGMVINASMPCDPPPLVTRIVLGVIFDLLKDGDTKPSTYVLVGENEPEKAWLGLIVISVGTAFGRQLLGKIYDDEVEVTSATGDTLYKIVGLWSSDEPDQVQSELELEPVQVRR